MPPSQSDVVVVIIFEDGRTIYNSSGDFFLFVFNLFLIRMAIIQSTMMNRLLESGLLRAM